MSEAPDIRDTLRLCTHCGELFSSRESLQRLSTELPPTYCRFSDLGSWGPRALCTLLREALRCSSYASNDDPEAPEALDGDVALSFAYQLSMADDSGDDEASEVEYDLSRTPNLDLFLRDANTGKVKLTAELEWYAIPEQVASLLGLQNRPAMQDWRTLTGFYVSQDYWKTPNFTLPVVDMIEDCCQAHRYCTAKETPLLPSMVIDVSASETDGTVRLHASEPGQRARYVALSYCWGGPQKLVTTLANRDSLQQGLEVGRLPRTIKDAIKVAASLQIRYVWIDALCIVQDDDASKAMEIEKMGEIYGDATLVLLAASGTARAADSGFLDPYRDIAVVPYYSASTGEVASVCLAVGVANAPPLDMRGWTYQERNRATRRLEFGGSRGVSFSCDEQTSSYVAGAWLSGEDSTGLISPASGDSAGPSTRWHEVIEEYSFRALTYAADRLPAIAGFASGCSPQPGVDEYLAGMWKSQIIDDIMWKGHFEGMDYRIPLAQYRSPGWSWVSVLDHVPNYTVGCVKNDLRRRRDAGGQEENIALYVRHDLQLAQPGTRFGRVLSGIITLRAKTASAGFAFELVSALLRRSCNYHLSEDEEGRVELLLTKFGSRWSMDVADQVENGYGALIILPVGDGTYRRLGSFWHWTSAVDVDEKDIEKIGWDDVPYREIMLV